MSLGVDLAAQDTFGAGDGEPGNFLAQIVFDPLDGGARLLLGRFARLSDETGRFRPGFFHQLGDLLVGGRAQLGRLLARLAQFFDGFLLGERQIRLRLVGRRQPLRDLGRTLVERLDDRRPHVFHREPAKDEEHHQLGDEGCVQIHDVCPL